MDSKQDCPFVSRSTSSAFHLSRNVSNLHKVMPPKSPDEPVFYDPDRNLWAAVRLGIVVSGDLTESGRLDPYASPNLPAPSPTNWAADIQASSPFGMQNRPNFGNSGFVVHTPNVPKTPPPTKRSQTTPPLAPVRPARKALGELTNSKDVEIRILKMELAEEEHAHKLSRGMLSRFMMVARDIENA